MENGLKYVEYVEKLYEQLNNKYQPPSKPEYPMN